MSEDMVKDGYEDIMNIDISPVAIDMMRKKYENIPHLKCILFSWSSFNDLKLQTGSLVVV